MLNGKVVFISGASSGIGAITAKMLADDIVIAMTNGGPGQSTWVPAYFTINALGPKGNLGYASAAATMMLAITLVIFLPLVAITALSRRRREETAK